MKAIKITEANKRNFKNKEVGKIYIMQVPKTFIRDGGVVFNYLNRSDLQTLDGWKDVIIPTITDEQYLGSLIGSGNTFTYEVLDKPQPIIEELHEQLISQADVVFDEYRDELTRATIDKILLGVNLNQLKGITQVLVNAKERIINDLNSKLANNDIAGLKAFTFDTEEAAMLKNELKKLK